jgi:hypothetical protein
MDAHKREWASLEAERRKLYPEYRTARDEMKELYAAINAFRATRRRGDA